MTTFVDDDEGYLAWVGDHPGGYVVNCGRRPTPAYLILHRATCGSIRSDTRANWTTGDYIKVCSEDLGDLRRWASGEVGGELQPCGSCSPLPDGSTSRDKRGKSAKRGGFWGRIGLDGGFPTIKTIVEFLAALAAVIGGLVAIIQWLS